MAFGVAAAAMTALTIAAMVVLPARLENDSGANVMLASSQAAAVHCVAALPESAVEMGSCMLPAQPPRLRGPP
jgi:hypothetical protein